MKLMEIDELELARWLKGRPPIIHELARRLPPGRLYRMKSTGHRVTLVAYDENGTVRVHVGGQYNVVALSRGVFGISPDDLEECDLPSPDEPVGDMGMDPDAFKLVGCNEED